jgi:hypothetical protein
VGIGATMQMLMLAVQNAVDYRQLGVAISSATMFRGIGGALGLSILGAIFSSQVAPPLEPAAFTDALDDVFLVAAFAAIPAFVVSWLIPERPLRESVTTTDQSHVFAAPKEADSLRELNARALGVLLGRQRIKTMIERTARRDLLARFLEARRQRLAALMEGWSPDQHHQLAVLLTALAREVDTDSDGPPHAAQLQDGQTEGKRRQGHQRCCCAWKHRRGPKRRGEGGSGGPAAEKRKVEDSDGDTAVRLPHEIADPPHQRGLPARLPREGERQTAHHREP